MGSARGLPGSRVTWPRAGSRLPWSRLLCFCAVADQYGESRSVVLSIAPRGGFSPQDAGVASAGHDQADSWDWNLLLRPEKAIRTARDRSCSWNAAHAGGGGEKGAKGTSPLIPHFPLPLDFC